MTGVGTKWFWNLVTNTLFVQSLLLFFTFYCIYVRDTVVFR